MERTRSRKEQRLERKALRRAEQQVQQRQAHLIGLDGQTGSVRLGAVPDLSERAMRLGGPAIQSDRGIPVFGQAADAATIDQMRTVVSEERAAYGVLMADNHRGYSMPVGGVVAYRRAVSPTGVGYDIGCGVCGVRTNLTAADLGVEREALGQVRLPEVERIMDQVVKTVRFGIGLNSGLGRDHAIFEDPRWSVDARVEALQSMSRDQLGTVGAGNHYVDLLIDQADRVWVGCHFGSRGFGHKMATGFLNLAAGRAWDAKAPRESDMAPARMLDLGTPLGDDYWTSMELAGEYARVGRRLVNEAVVSLLGGMVLEVVENNHNLAWKEQHDVGEGLEELVVVRKGATPAFPGQMGFVGGSMGDDCVIVRGVDTGAAAAALRSTVHGAGRALSRTQAAGKMNYKTRQRQGGLISPEAMMEWVNRRGVVLRGGASDESPQAYKRLDDVLAAHTGAIEIAQVLRPIGVAMAGVGDEDPYKD